MAAVCGIDWAAEFHDVRIADEHGHVLAEQRFAHDEARHRRADCAACLPARRAGRDRAPGRACSLGGCWRPGCACWRSIPTRSPLPVIASGPPPARATASTRWCWPSSRAPTATASRVWLPSATRPPRCARSLEPARNSSPRGLRWPTSCAPSWTPSGRRDPHLQQTSTARSRSPSWQRYPSPTDARGPRSQAPRGLPGPPQLLRPPARRASCWPECAAPRRGHRRARERRSPRRRARPGRRAGPAGRADQPAHQPDPRRHPQPPRRADVPELLPRPQKRHLRRRTAGRDRRRPRPLPDHRDPRRRRRPSARHKAIRQAPRRHLPLGLRQTPQKPHRHPRRQPPATGTPGPTTPTTAPATAAPTTPTPLRILGRAWTRVLWRCWQDNIPYDITQHRSRNTPPHHPGLTQGVSRGHSFLDLVPPRLLTVGH